ncbi:MAG: group I intron-associated PD-(D/E)XK endonuclease [Solirubrobacteraceae bacterium]|nr:group I intron-associated PD-(D/E)XK endonuclease [Solirubrobacteraceae bacterium]
MELTTSQKGGLAELKIAAQAADLGIDVYRPMIDGARCDLVFDTGAGLLRIQCKWATRKGDVIAVRLRTSRHSPSRGYVSTTYSASEIDGIAASATSSTAAISYRSTSSPDARSRICVSALRGTANSSVLRWLPITRLGL